MLPALWIAVTSESETRNESTSFVFFSVLFLPLW